ncbi:MAG TPA: hypothetical protein VFS71_15590 [Flavobacterium sp.]|uniref:hypothetical protein n=1 Tax=Flavobacterium sp. TaxID=239 RepID=UPI002DBAD06B|nr:hypothetical protein [Flavobacterium sp.]HEU4791110.1 hypothetical protein [Flavobacterium sp.]
MKTILTMFVAMLALSFTSCKKESDKEATPAESSPEKVAVKEEPAFEPFKVMVITHTVKDFDTWKKAFDEHESVRTASGLTLRALGRDMDNPNKVYVFLNMEDLQKAKDFAANPELKERMKKGGVTSAPEFIYADVIRFEESPATLKGRVRIGHKVKDFDAWLKGYDAEGKETRMVNGLVDRAISRSIDDPNMVYVTFAISDLEKAKARIKDPALKKIMTDAGVIGKPDVVFYNAVE